MAVRKGAAKEVARAPPFAFVQRGTGTRRCRQGTGGHETLSAADQRPRRRERPHQGEVVVYTKADIPASSTRAEEPSTMAPTTP
jgi:hypothetical protein